MYTGVLLLIVICTIMGPSYVHCLLWGLTPVHKMVPEYIECHSCVTIMIPSYVHRLLCGVLATPAHKMMQRTNLIYRSSFR